MNTNRFDLEQEILACWGVTGDIQLIIDAYDEMNPEEVLATLKAIKALYELKFTRAFNTFEQCVSKREIFKPD